MSRPKRLAGDGAPAPVDLGHPVVSQRMRHLMRRFAISSEGAALLASMIWMEGQE